jgi:WD40 repeat protein
MGRFLLFAMLTLNLTFLHSQQPEISLQTGHTGTINSIKFSPDGKIIASASADNNIILWDSKNGKQINILSGHTAPVNSVVFQTNGKFLFSVGADGYLIVWDWRAGTIDKKIKIANDALKSVVITADSKFLYIGSSSIHCYDIVQERSELLFAADIDVDCNIAINDKEQTLAYANSENTRRTVIYDYKGKHAVASFEDHSTFLAFSKPGDCLFSGNTKGELRKRNAPGYSDAGAFNIIEVFKKSKAPILCIISDTGNFYMANKEKLIYAYNRKGYVRFILRGHTGFPKCMDLSADGKILISAGEDQRIYFWNGVNGKLIKTTEGTCDRINSFAYSKDGMSIVLGYDKGLIKHWNLQDNSFINYRMTSKKRNWRYRIVRVDSVSGKNAFLTAVYYSVYSKTGCVKEEILDRLEWNFVTNKMRATDYKKRRYSENERTPGLILDNEEKCFPTMKICGRAVGDTLLLSGTHGNTLYRKILTTHEGGINCFALNSAFGFFSTIGKDGLIMNWSLMGDMEGIQAAFDEKDFLFLNKENYYYASKGALKNVGFRIRENIFSFDQFDVKYNRPDLALKGFHYVDTLLLTSYKNAYLKRLQKNGIADQEAVLGKGAPFLFVNLPQELNTENALFEFSISAVDSTGLLENLFVNINGVPTVSKNGEKVGLAKVGRKISLTLSPGKNEIQVYVTNSKKISSDKFSFQAVLSTKKEKPDLYLVSIGAGHFVEKEYDLVYSEKDAKDVVELFSKSKNYKSVYTRTYLSESVMKDSLPFIRKFVEGAAINDVVIVFVAGHGILDKNLDYYFSTYNVQFTDPGKNGISYDDLSGLLDNIKARKKVLMIDACHSGEIDKEEVELMAKDTLISEGKLTFRNAGSTIRKKGDLNLKSSFELSKLLFADMRLSSGTTVLSSAGGAEYALESKDWKNGAFTYCFLKGIKSRKADLNEDGEIWLSEMQEYLYIKVSEITQGRQVSTSRTENLQNDFKIW